VGRRHEAGRDYWLYVVVDALSDPKLYVIRDPASQVPPVEKVGVVRYVLPRDSWIAKAERAL